MSVSAALVIGAIGANQRWLDRHFLPSFFVPRPWYVAIETTVRVLVAIAGVWLALIGRPRAGRIAARSPMLVVSVVTVLVILASGLFYFRRMERTFADRV